MLVEPTATYDGVLIVILYNTLGWQSQDIETMGWYMSSYTTRAVPFCSQGDNRSCYIDLHHQGIQDFENTTHQTPMLCPCSAHAVLSIRPRHETWLKQQTGGDRPGPSLVTQQEPKTISLDSWWISPSGCWVLVLLWHLLGRNVTSLSHWKPKNYQRVIATLVGYQPPTQPSSGIIIIIKHHQSTITTGFFGWLVGDLIQFLAEPYHIDTNEMQTPWKYEISSNQK